MNLGYWRRGDHAMHTHILDPLDGSPGCHAWATRSADMVAFEGGLRQVDCRRCLVMERARLKRANQLVELRLAGKAGIQRDAFEGKL